MTQQRNAMLTHNTPLGDEQGPGSTIGVRSPSKRGPSYHSQLVLLLGRQLPEIDALNLSANRWRQVSHFRCGSEQRFLVGISKQGSLGDL